MNQSHRYLFGLLITALCASATAKTMEMQGTTGVVVFRDTTHRHYIAPSPMIYLDGQLLGRLAKRSTLSSALTPGQHNLHIKGNFLFEMSASDLNFTVRPGHITQVGHNSEL